MTPPADTNDRAPEVTVLEPAKYAISLSRLGLFVLAAIPVVLWAWTHTKRLEQWAENHTRQLDEMVSEMRAIRGELQQLKSSVPETHDFEAWRLEFQARNPTLVVPVLRVRQR